MIWNHNCIYLYQVSNEFWLNWNTRHYEVYIFRSISDYIFLLIPCWKSCLFHQKRPIPSVYSTLNKYFSRFVTFPSHVNNIRNKKSPLMFFWHIASIILQFSSLNSLRQISTCLFMVIKRSVPRRRFSYHSWQKTVHITTSSLRPINYPIKECVNMLSSNLMIDR